MALIEQSIALADLQQHLPVIRNSMVEGWEKYQRLPEDDKVDHSPGTRASLVHDYTVSYAAVHIPEADISNQSQLKLFLLGPYVFRFKKLDRKLKPRNQPTKQVKDFRGQQNLAGVSGIYHLEAGYILNEFGTEINSLHLLCPNGKKKPYWHVELKETIAAVNTVEMFAPDGSVLDQSNESMTFTHKGTDEVVPFPKNTKNENRD